MKHAVTMSALTNRQVFVTCGPCGHLGFYKTMIHAAKAADHHLDQPAQKKVSQ